jgi:hypothetical protein
LHMRFIHSLIRERDQPYIYKIKLFYLCEHFLKLQQTK